ncbi:MAG: family 10 glycosylhydrolase [Eubacterium sp.]
MIILSDTDKSIDNAEYQKYLKKGGKSSLSDWRRENVSNMIKSVYSAVKSVNKKVKFGISPASNIDNDYSSLYADVEKWSQDSGYIDYICPQIYFGFKNVKQPFMQTTKKWTNTAKCDLYIGLPLYKCSKPDEYAAKNDESIINEFKNNNDIIARQIRYIKNFDEIGGFYLFSYSCLFDENCKNEVENLLKEMRE